ncbi:MFS transporter [Pelomicrobium sp.]|uniref:MFS transporter n=1 Tax=Pelomicrobium sp. TaxID=2815319 RepID=UPI002FDDDD4F
MNRASESDASPSSLALACGVRPIEVWAWAMYDFANSGYTTVVITAVFNAYFVAVVAENAPWGSFAWTASLGISYALIIVTAPLIGALADARAVKKPLLLLTTVGCVAFTAALALVGRGDLALGAALIILSNFFFGSGENLIAAFLPELARGPALGKVSGWGWALGYLGGLVSLGACLGYVAWAEARGQTAEQFVPITMVITAGLFALASIPTFAFLRERAKPQAAGPLSLARDGFARLRQTLARAREFRDLGRFLLCVVFYQAGIQTVVALAAVYAQQAMGFGTQETLLLILVVNVTAAVGAFAFGYLQDRIGHKAAVSLILLGWLATAVLAGWADTRSLFWTVANLAGLCLGSAQSAGRALVGYLSPATRRAEFFGLWGLAVKLSAILGPITYGIITWVTAGDHRLAMLSMGIFFLAGMAVLAGVDVERGRRAALREAV